MTRPPATTELGPEEWSRVNAVASRFESACREEGLAEPAAFLPPPGDPARLRILKELVKIDLEVRWRLGRGLPLEDYARRFPELGPADALSVGLIVEEYRARHLYGDRPPLEGYARRFPSRFEELRRRLGDDPAGHRDQTVIGTGVKTHPHVKLPGGEKPGAVTPYSDPDMNGPPHYKLLRKLGDGEFGEVFLAEAPGGHHVAVKRSKKQLDDEASQKEVNALQALREVRHIFLLKLDASWVDDGRLHIAMELAEDSLLDRFRQCQNQGQPGIARDELLRYFGEVAEALDYLHGHKLIHRDIKPANLMRLNGRAKVADFGLVRLLDSSDMAGKTVCGTPRYMAPEVWMGACVPESDQYSLACTYGEMRTGRPVFPGGAWEVMQRKMNSNWDLAGLPEPEREVLARAVAKEPEQRYPSCSAFVTALLEARETPPPPPAPPRFGRRAALALCVVAFCLACAAGFWRLSPPPTVLPTGFDAAPGAEKAPVAGKLYWTRIRTTRAGPPAEFVFIHPDERVPTPAFYMMCRKVSRAQFRTAAGDPAFKDLIERYRVAGDHPGGDWEKEWAPDRDDDGLPATSVTVTEAHCFAEWLGGDRGHLPSCEEWDKAGGGCDGAATPFDEARGGKPAIKLPRPLPVERPDAEQSMFGCYDMAGNVREWTRTLGRIGNSRDKVPLTRPAEQTDVVLVRGAAWHSTRPFRFLREDGRARDPELYPYTRPRTDTGFRVAIELP